MAARDDKVPTDFLLSGIALLIAGLTMAALAGAVMKLLADKLPVALIVWFRFAGFFLLLLPITVFWFGKDVLKPIPLPLQVLRGSLLPLSTAFFILGARSMNYAEAIAVLYVYPFIITLVGPWLLGEPSRLMSWIGVGGGFFGVILIMQPTAQGLQEAGTLWVLARLSHRGCGRHGGQMADRQGENRRSMWFIVQDFRRSMSAIWPRPSGSPRRAIGVVERLNRMTPYAFRRSPSRVDPPWAMTLHYPVRKAG